MKYIFGLIFFMVLCVGSIPIVTGLDGSGTLFIETSPSNKTTDIIYEDTLTNVDIRIISLIEGNESIFLQESFNEFDKKAFQLPPGLYKIRIYKQGSSDYWEYNNDGRGINITSGLNTTYVASLHPHVLADSPWRIKPGVDIPILFFVHEAELEDYYVYDIKVYYNYDSDNPQLIDTIDFSEDGTCPITGETYKIIDEENWYQIKYYNPNLFTKDPITGQRRIKVVFDGVANPLCTLQIFPDKVSKFNVIQSDYELPSLINWYSGDTHYHSVYTDNSVEFGNPIEATVEAGEAIGLDWVTITDHSFSLDSNTPTNQQTGRWAERNNELSLYAGDNTFRTIRAEEVSALGMAASYYVL